MRPGQDGAAGAKGDRRARRQVIPAEGPHDDHLAAACGAAACGVWPDENHGIMTVVAVGDDPAGQAGGPVGVSRAQLDLLGPDQDGDPPLAALPSRRRLA